MRARRALAPLVAALSAACATLGTEGAGEPNLPTSDVGPFRKLEKSEVLGVAPYVLDGEGVAPYRGAGGPRARPETRRAWRLRSTSTRP